MIDGEECQPDTLLPIQLTIHALLQNLLPACSAASQCLFVAAVLYERSIAQQELRTWQMAEQSWLPEQDEQGDRRHALLPWHSAYCDAFHVFTEQACSSDSHFAFRLMGFNNQYCRCNICLSALILE